MAPSRPVAPNLRALLDVVALCERRRLPMPEFELRMHQRGYDSVSVSRAMAALERRGWGMREAGAVELTEAGWQIAQQGVRRPPKSVKPRPVYTRMPKGLFS